MKRLLNALAATVLATSSFAQTPDTSPSPELKKLSWMIGEWSGKVAMEMEGMKFDSVQTMKVDWDGKFLRATTVMDMMGMKMTESMFIGYEAATKKYVCHSFTNFSSNPRVERGGMEGEKFVTVSDPWVVEGMPAATVSRASMWLSGKDLKVTLEFKEGNKWALIGIGTMIKK